MLVELHVVDLGIVADLDLVLAPGMTAITGETGAGKTLIVTAVDLLCGGRADGGLVRDGAEEARVEGRFVDAATGEETVLARHLPRDGRSRAYVDGRLVTVGELTDRGAVLLDLHGQHAHQSLLEPSSQRRALDDFVGAPAAEALAAYREARAELAQVTADLERLGGDERARAHEVDLLRFQVGEIDAAAIVDDDEDELLDAQESLLADALAHREALAAAYAELEDDALDAVGRTVGLLDGRGPFRAITDRLRSAQAELADLAQELRTAGEDVVEDPERLAALRTRRHLLHDLRRKYGDTLAEVARFGAEAAARLDDLERREERAAALEQQRRVTEARVRAAADALTAARAAGAAPLARAVEEHLHELAMPRAELSVEVSPAEPGDDGADRVVFMLAANPGETARPLAKAASGGELARAMLAVRVVLSEAPPTLVFDEVDAGIGGEAGLAVGRLLALLGRGHQVLCVTHLAQVAAFADTQVQVEKTVATDTAARRGEERTVATAARVVDDERVLELSRMLAGVGASTHARRHAAELLETARAAIA